MTGKVFAAVANAASIIGLATFSTNSRGVTFIIVTVALICLGYLIYDAYKNSLVNERICKSEEEIEQAMRELIKTQGKVCIMSRDLSWVSPEIMGCLENKRGSVTIFAQEENEITKTLREKQVNIKYYGEYGFEPKTRFTVIRYNTDRPQVAIANMEYSIRKGNRFRHVIYETAVRGSQQDSWINSLAVDMINLCNLVCKEKK